MSKEFVLMQCATKLHDHLSRERYNLQKMWDNPNVSESLYATRVRQFNELAETLNVLYASQMGVSESLFDLHPPYEPDAVAAEPVAPVVPEPLPSFTPEPEPVIGVDVAADGQNRADAVLKEYAASSEQDIALHDPSDHVPVSVLPEPAHHEDTPDALDADDALEDELEDESDEVDAEPEDELEPDEDEEPEEQPVPDAAGQEWLDTSSEFEHGGSYINHTPTGVRVDNDPTQIASVETAVERDGTKSYMGTSVDVGAYRGVPTMAGNMDDILENELAGLRKKRDE